MMNHESFTWQGVKFEWVPERNAYCGIFVIAAREHRFMVQGGNPSYQTGPLSVWAEWEGGYTRARSASARDQALMQTARELYEFARDYGEQVEKRFEELRSIWTGP